VYDNSVLPEDPGPRRILEGERVLMNSPEGRRDRQAGRQTNNDNTVIQYKRND